MSRSLENASANRPEVDFWKSTSSLGANRSFDPFVHFRPVLQYKWWIIAFTLVAVFLAVAYSLTATPLYRSTQALLLEVTDTNVMSVDELVNTAEERDGYVQTQIEILQSRDTIERVIDSLDLLTNPVFADKLAKKSGLDSADILATSDRVSPTVQALTMIEKQALAVDYMLDGLSVREVPTTQFLHISFLSSDSALAANIANEIGLQYILRYVESNRDLFTEVSGWLDGRLAKLKESLDASEQRLLVFKNENGLVGVGGDVGRIGEQALLQSTADLAEARLRLSIVSDQLEEVRNEPTTVGRLSHLQSDTLIRQTRVDIRQMTQEIQSLSTKFGPRHPQRIKMDVELSALRASLEQSITQAIASLENERRLLSRQVTSFEARLSASRDAIRDVDTKSVEFAVLEREVQTNRELYYRFFDRMVEARSTQGLESTNATVVEYARASLMPAKPDKLFIIVLTALGAMACATLAAIVVNAFDDSIRRLADVKERLGSPLLGVVPTYSHTRERSKHPLRFSRSATDAKANRMFAEAFKSIRTNILLDDRKSERRVVLLTSSVPGEGKSMSSICLARTLAPIERVLLIDADIRRPSIARALRLDNKAPGLTHLLSGRCGMAQVVQHYALGGYDVLPSGVSTDHPLELLFSSRFEDLLTELAGSYDRVIIDCAPVEAVSDALILSRLADMVIYVAKAHDTSIRLVASGLEKLRNADAPTPELLLTQVNLNKLSSYGADYEFHGYHDYYDYAEPTRNVALSLDREDLRNLGMRERRGRKETEELSTAV